MKHSLPSKQKVMKHSESLKFKFLELKGALQVLSSQNSFITWSQSQQDGTTGQAARVILLGISAYRAKELEAIYGT
jgi:hypothetical protein